ncbi:MAG: endonuclease/exonuclease/phosphatase family protein [Gemmataceae bacterium]|nr:endonuclease/exonuclease/phosphatase family protein [Gemmataceae bacterium]
MELDSRWVAALQPLAEHYPFHQTWPDDSGNFGIGVWSRLPVDRWALEGFGESSAQVDVVARLPVGSPEGERPFRFLGLHPAPPVSADYTARRNRVYGEVAARLAAEPELPVVVAGDSNNTRFAPSFLRFCQQAGLYDTAHGRMAWRTWPAGAPSAILGVQIDHVLVSGGWRVCDFRRGPDIGSDHYPVIADLWLILPAGQASP